MSVRSIGKYEIVSTLGRGSMGVVYKGKDPEIGRLVAIKTLKSVFMGDDPAGNEALQRFRQESRSAGKLQHPNIVTIFEAGRTENGSPYIVMEYIEGRSIEVILSEGARTEPPAVMHYLSQIACAVDYAHSQNVIHRDIKPSNILVDGRHCAHLLDFGVAKLSDTSLTPAGTVVGTPSYMSPEQIRGMTLDGRTDIFSLGVVAFESLAGVRPFPGNDFTTVVSNIIHKEPLTFKELDLKHPLGVETVLQKVLSKERENRYDSALEFVNALASEFKLTVDGAGLVGGYRPGMPWGENSSLLTSPGTAVPASVLQARDSFQEAKVDEVEEDAALGSEPTADATTNDPKEPKHVPETHGQKSVPTSISEKGSASSVNRGASLGKQLFGFGAAVLMVLALGYFIFSPHLERLVSKDTDTEELGVSSTEVAENSPPSLAIFESSPSAEGDASPEASSKTKEPKEVSRESVVELSDSDLRRVLSWEDADPQILQLAIREAGERKGEGLQPGLVQLLKNKHFSVRVAALKVLGQKEFLSDSEVISAIISSLDDQDPIVRGFSAKILGQVNQEVVSEALAARLKKEESEVVIRVINNSLKR